MAACWETRVKTIKYCFHRSFLHKVGRTSSEPDGAKMSDHTTGVAQGGNSICEANSLVRYPVVMAVQGSKPLSGTRTSSVAAITDVSKFSP